MGTENQYFLLTALLDYMYTLTEPLQVEDYLVCDQRRQHQTVHLLNTATKK